MYSSVHVKCPTFLPSFNHMFIFRSLQYKIPRKPIQWKLWYTWTERQWDMKLLKGTFHNVQWSLKKRNVLVDLIFCRSSNPISMTQESFVIWQIYSYTLEESNASKWRWRQWVPPKHGYPPTNLHDITLGNNHPNTGSFKKIWTSSTLATEVTGPDILWFFPMGIR